MAGKENEPLNDEVQKLRTGLALQSKLCDQLTDANAKHESNLARLSAERNFTIRDLAETAGRQVAQTEQIKSLERRALSAELRLEKEMKRRARPQKKHGA